MMTSSSIPTSSSSHENQQNKRPRFDPGRLPANREEVDVKLLESAEYLQEWTVLMDKTENMAASEISKVDLLKHVSLKRKLHENLGILARLAQIHTMKAKQNLLQQQPRNNTQQESASNATLLKPHPATTEEDVNINTPASTHVDRSADAVTLSGQVVSHFGASSATTSNP